MPRDEVERVGSRAALTLRTAGAEYIIEPASDLLASLEALRRRLEAGGP